jgi:hypothetical protein
MRSLSPTFLVYIHEVWTLGKTYGIKLRCCWEPFENLMRTWEHIDNKKKKQKISPPQGKIWIPMNACVSLFIGYMKLLFPKLFVNIFYLAYW